MVVRGICDYADSHINDMWYKYASATVRAFASLFSSFVRSLFDSEPRWMGLRLLYRRSGKHHEWDAALKESQP